MTIEEYKTILLTICSFSMVSLLSVIAWLAKRAISSIDRLNEQVGKVILQVQLHDIRLTRLEKGE